MGPGWAGSWGSWGGEEGVWAPNLCIGQEQATAGLSFCSLRLCLDAASLLRTSLVIDLNFSQQKATNK